MSCRGRTDGRKGQVIVLAPIFLVAVMFALAFAVDVGHVAAVKSRLQNGADAAALAATQVLVQQRRDGAGEPAAREAALAEAERIFAENAADASLSLEFGTQQPDGTFTATGTEIPATAVRAGASRGEGAPEGDLPTLFAGFFGVNSCQVDAVGLVQTSPSITQVSQGVAPFAVPEDSVAGIGGVMEFYPGDDQADPVAPGAWGLLNLDGGSTGTSELRDWITDGYPFPVDVGGGGNGVWMDGTTGFRATLQQTLQDKIGDQLVVVVYDQVTGTGHNADFHCIGFLGLTLTDVKLTGNDPYVKGRVTGLMSVQDVIAGSGGYDSPNLRKVQITG
ncbi:MAG: pilus assembly protein TadG-related protein [Planctomycetota bacterium]